MDFTETITKYNGLSNNFVYVFLRVRNRYLMVTYPLQFKKERLSIFVTKTKQVVNRG